jgi:hypothetical protein
MFIYTQFVLEKFNKYTLHYYFIEIKQNIKLFSPGEIQFYYNTNLKQNLCVLNFI